ncbi:MAG: acylphosphatase [Phycisphaeraceae bacterium]|nr:acylphosphatase [Phycisphaeraceae bacterium]
MIRKTVFYTGRVQGVGFRYTTANLAKRFDVAGYVQNLEDGKVRLDVQGSADQVHGLLDAVDQAMTGNIQGKDITDHPADPALGDPREPDAFGVLY